MIAQATQGFNMGMLLLGRANATGRVWDDR